MNVSVARLTEWRDRALAGAATALKERERDERDDFPAEIQGERDHHGQRTALRQDRGAGGQTPFGPGGRDDEPDALALLCSHLWSVASCARVEGARAPVSVRQRLMPSPTSERHLPAFLFSIRAYPGLPLFDAGRRFRSGVSIPRASRATWPTFTLATVSRYRPYFLPGILLVP